MQTSTLLLLLAGSLGTAAWAAEPSCRIVDAAALDRAVWLLCEEGKILIGAGPEREWQEKVVPTGGTLRAIRFLDSSRGVAVGRNSTLLATEDGGLDWRRIPVPVQEHLTAIHSVGRSVWVAGWGGLVLHSGDGGRTWERQATGTTQGLESIYFADETHGWAAGWVGTIIRTTDGGATWEQVRSPAAMWSLNSIYFRDRSDGWAVGFGGEILRSRDGGRTWEIQPSPVKGTLTCVRFDESGKGWITTDDGLLASEDSGESWRHIHVEDSLFLSGLLRRGGSLWAVGPRGLWREADDGVAWRKEVAPMPEALRADERLTRGAAQRDAPASQ